VLERPIGGEPRVTDDWWDNLVNSYRRFDAESMPGVKVDISFRGVTATATTDAEGYYEAEFAPPTEHTKPKDLWQTAEVRRSEGGPVFLQSVLCVPVGAKFGLISDIDDTVLQSNVSHWQAALQHTFLSNARTRKPLEGVGQLYTSFQKGPDGKGANPIFYVSASPWNVYDLLVDFMALNDLPDGPILLRDVDFNTASFLHNAGPHSKLAKIHEIIDRYPSLQWILVGDSGQIDAELYAQTVVKYPGRVLAVYIRDIDPGADSQRDRFVDTYIERIAGSKVPMLRVSDSNAIAEHARKLGLIEPEEIAKVEKEVAKDQARPDAAQAAQETTAKVAADPRITPGAAPPP
jgi:phosphatidate phosphatase APP1